MTKTALARYRDRMRRVLDHVDRHLDDTLDLERLSAVAAFSPHHFHRQFSALIGMPVHRYVQLMRLKRASYRLAFRPDIRVTDIALDAGYDAPEAFCRAFRTRFRQTPSDFRKAPDWDPWLSALKALTGARAMLSDQTFNPEGVTLVDFPETPVAMMEHRGDPALLGDTIRHFIAWRRRTGIRPPRSATFTVFHADPEAVPAEAYRISLCAATHQCVAPNEEGVMNAMIPAGRCARLRITGASDDLRPAAVFLYGSWLPASGQEARDFPLFAQRVSFYPDVPEHEAVTDLFLPLK